MCMCVYMYVCMCMCMCMYVLCVLLISKIVNSMFVMTAHSFGIRGVGVGRTYSQQLDTPTIHHPRQQP